MEQSHVGENDKGEERGEYQQQRGHAPECRLRHGNAAVVALNLSGRFLAFFADMRYGAVGNGIDSVQQRLSVIFRTPYWE